MHYSDLVGLRFGKAADTYDSSAFTHVEIARHLLSMIQRHIDNDKQASSALQAHHAYLSTCSEALSHVQHALDVGAGTGILSEELLKAFPNVDLTLMDISSEMLARAEKKYHGRVSYIKANAEDFPIRGFDILVSSMAMQWFRDIEAFIAENIKHTRTIAFAIPILGTFDEWYDWLEARGIESHRMPYKSFDQMMSLCNLANHFIAEERTYPLTFKSALDFVKYLKLIGASACHTGVYSYKESASILQALHACHAAKLLHNEMFFARHLCRSARKNADTRVVAQNRSVLDVHEDSLERNIACAANTEANCKKEPLCSSLATGAESGSNVTLATSYRIFFGVLSVNRDRP
ncbi:hypothetical protein FACS189472_03850 [Alphaproteobacteria bacterium]|nr:hypothetical protein FACS189472_03850 [Alphaproteobacteria bacterium]